MAQARSMMSKSDERQLAAMQQEMRSVTHSVLLILLIFGALTAVFGGFGLIATNGAGLSLSLLSGSWFSSFLLPGIILLVIVGGSQSVALAAELYSYSWRRLATAIAGFVLMGWIFTESYITHASSFLQFFYFIVGVVELWCTLVLLGLFRTPSPET